MDNEGWVEEVHELWKGQKFCLKMKKQLFHEQSPYQDIKMFESETYGNVLLLDGIIQCTERDEAAYSEMMAHVPLCSLKDPPKHVLVIGGGDGGVVRELTKYDSIRHIDVAEIDKYIQNNKPGCILGSRMVVDISKQYLPKMSIGFDDARVELHITDGCAYVKNAEEGSYDAVIVDSSDPVGPALALYTKDFYAAVHRALRPGGVVCSMAECMWLKVDIITQVALAMKAVFLNEIEEAMFVRSGQIAMLVAMKHDPKQQDLSPLVPKKLHFREGAHNSVSLQYYNEKIHEAAFVLPEFIKKILDDVLTHQ